MRAGWMRPSGEQLLQRHPRDLAAHAVEARQDHGVRRVVDDEVDAGQVLEGADVAALAADDPALHVVGGQLDDGHGRLGRVPGGEPLHHDGEDVAHAPVGVALGLLLDLAHEPRRVVPDLVLEVLEQELLGLAGAEPGDALQGSRTCRSWAAAASSRRCSRRASRSSSSALAGVDGAFTRDQPLLHTADLLPAVERVVRLGLRGLLGGRRARGPGARRGRAGVREPGARLTSSSAAITRPTARTAAAITSFHCPCPLSERRPAGRGEIRCFLSGGPGAAALRICSKAADRVTPGCPERGIEHGRRPDPPAAASVGG